MKHNPELLAHVERNLRFAFGTAVLGVGHVGSMYIMGEGNDLDVVLWLKRDIEWGPTLEGEGYAYTGADSGEEDGFNTFRNGTVNLILTESEDFFYGFLQAAEICKQLVMWQVPLTKEMRIKLHRIRMNEENAV